jgi:hypothetical protein
VNTYKSLAVVAALLAGGTSLAIAQNGPATGGEPPVAGGAAGNPSAPSVHHHAVKRHGRMYMSEKGVGSRGTLRTGSASSNMKHHTNQ